MRMGNLQEDEGQGTYIGGEFFLGDSETMGHRGYLAYMPLPEALLFNILDSKYHFKIFLKHISLNLLGGNGVEPMVLSGSSFFFFF